MGLGRSTDGSSCFLWGEKCLFVGCPPVAEAHSHYVLEVCLPLDGWLDARTEDGLEVRRAAGLVVGSHTHHWVQFDARLVAVVFVGPLTDWGGRLRRFLGPRGMRELPRTVARNTITGLLDLSCGNHELPVAERACDALLAGVGGFEPPPPADPHVLQAMSLVYRSLEEEVPVRRFAREVGLHERRFGKLFRDHVGMSLRQYRRWIRLRAGLAVALAGESLTTAAHEAGFADSAHFTRTCRQTFGLPPSAIPRVQAFAEDPTSRLEILYPVVRVAFDGEFQQPVVA